MQEDNIFEFAGRDVVSNPLTDLLRTSARKLLQTAVEAELESFLVQFKDQRTFAGRAMIVRNGHHPERAVQTVMGPVTVQVSKVRTKVSGGRNSP